MRATRRWRRLGWTAAVGALLWAPLSLADRRALSLDVSAGATALSLAPLYAQGVHPTIGTTPSFGAGLRYAPSNRFELTAAGFFEPGVTYFHNGVTVVTENGAFLGTLRHSLSRHGATIGARMAFGLVWRMVAGMEVGFSRRLYSGIKHLDDSDPAHPVDYQLALPAAQVDNLLVAPVAGIVWEAGDHWSLSLLPRLEFLVGQQATWCVTLPLSFGWAFYL